MTINERIRKLRLPEKSTPEDLQTGWSDVLKFGDYIILAGHYYNGPGKPSYYGAVYEYLTDDTSIEGIIGLRNVSDVVFEDNGHAVAWAMATC